MAIRSIGFDPGPTDPIDDMGIGRRNIINRILDDNGNCLSSCKGKIYNDENIKGLVIETLPGNLVLKSRRQSEILREFRVSNLILKPQEGSNITILDELHPDELFKRIRSYYKYFIHLTPEDQKKIMSETSIFSSFRWEDILSMINKSKNYIIKLPNEPSDKKKKEISQQVFCENQRLYYGHELEDDYSVQMGAYALELGNQLFGTPEFCLLPLT